GRNAAMAVMRRVAVCQHMTVLPFPLKEHAVPRDKDLIEDDHSGRLAILSREKRAAVLELFAGPPRRTRHDGDSLRIHRDRAADREIRILPAHIATRHDQEFMHVWG